ncbi:MAG: hypothetical protein GY827_04545 [Cytophagales bacterium]|nr:hypothetical protein [Cytophagales bacterium]
MSKNTEFLKKFREKVGGESFKKFEKEMKDQLNKKYTDEEKKQIVADFIDERDNFDMSKDRSEFTMIPYRVHNLYYKYQEKFKNGIEISTLRELHNKENPFRKWPIDLDESLGKLLDLDDLYFADFEVKDGIFDRIKYEPFVCSFKTSGKIIVENDLRQFFDETPDYNVNATKGIIETMDDYQNQGMLHGFVGNSCPGLYLNKKTGVVQIGAKYDEETYEPILPDGFEQLTSVCTDLWWYSIVDLEVMKQRHPDFNEEDYEVVEIPAGTYTLEHSYGVVGYNEDVPFATLKLMK